VRQVGVGDLSCHAAPYGLRVRSTYRPEGTGLFLSRKVSPSAIAGWV